MNESLVNELVKVLEALIEPVERVTLPAMALARVGAPEGIDEAIDQLRIKLPDWAVRKIDNEVIFVRHA